MKKERHRRLPRREAVFIESLLYHGFRKTNQRKNLKYRKGYVIPATRREDAGGIDFWIKMPRDDRLFPVQVTQRGVRIQRRLKKISGHEIREFTARSDDRIRKKRMRCKRHGIAFVLVRDFCGTTSNACIAWGDIKALRYAIAHLQRWL